MTLAEFSRARSGALNGPRLRARRGFSMVELMVTLALIGVVATISGGRVSAMRSQQQVSRSASLIQTQMEKAFALAGRNRAPVHIVWNSTKMNLSVTDRTEVTVYGSANLGDFGLKSGEVTVTRATTEVYPNGFAQDTLSITITALRGGNTYAKRVRMSRAGLVKVI